MTKIRRGVTRRGEAANEIESALLRVFVAWREIIGPVSGSAVGCWGEFFGFHAASRSKRSEDPCPRYTRSRRGERASRGVDVPGFQGSGPH